MQKRTVRVGRPRGAKTFDEGVAIAVGIALREKRLALGIAQEALAALAQVERSHMGKIERGEHLPSLTMLLRLSTALDERPGSLIDRVQALLEGK